MEDRRLSNSFIPVNLGYMLAVWVGFYEGVTPVAWVVSALAWLLVLAYGPLLFDIRHCVRLAHRGPPCPEWMTHAVNVTVGAALLAADAHWTAAAWILSAVTEQLIYWRGRRALAACAASDVEA